MSIWQIQVQYSLPLAAKWSNGPLQQLVENFVCVPYSIVGFEECLPWLPPACLLETVLIRADKWLKTVKMRLENQNNVLEDAAQLCSAERNCSWVTIHFGFIIIGDSFYTK